MNVAIRILWSTMRMVLSSDTKDELGTEFFNAKEGTMICTILTQMGNPQPTTPLQVDNSCADGIINGTMKQRRYKLSTWVYIG